MDDERFDSIIVGEGLANSSTAYKLASAGLSVLLVERRIAAGAKNMTGGRLYTYSLEELIPDFRDRAPLEKKQLKNESAS